ncbi:MAG: hypothetical protein ABJK25_11110 [Halieaceae bacterium]
MTAAGRSKVFLVAGMHRSGTSALCAALSRCGVHFGEDLLDAIQGVNDEGFWEDSEVVTLNDSLLSTIGSFWYSLEYSDDTDWSAPLFDSQRRKAERILKRGFGGELVAVKDPRFCLTLPFWLDVLSGAGKEIQVVSISRSPIEVALSLHKRDGFPVSYGLRLVELYQRALEKSLPDSAIRVTFDSLLENPAAVMASLGLALPEETSDAEQTSGVRAELRHHKDKGDNDVLSRPIASADDLRQFGELLDHDYPLDKCLAELAAAFTGRGAELTELGEVHAEALATLDQRDLDIDALSGEHKEALATIAERDQQIAELDQRLARAGAELELAMSTIAERDEQIAEFDRRLSALGEEHSHALKVINERDAQIAEREAQLDRIRNIPGVGLVARRLLS